jgi:hypothetical protein
MLPFRPPYVEIAILIFMQHDGGLGESFKLLTLFAAIVNFFPLLDAPGRPSSFKNEKF